MPGDYTLGKVCSLLDNLRRNFESQTKRKLKTVLVFMLFMQVARSTLRFTKTAPIATNVAVSCSGPGAQLSSSLKRLAATAAAASSPTFKDRR